MNKKRNIITIKAGRLAAALFFAFAVFSASTTAVWAHGGFDHVIGTVAGVSGNVLTVKTAKGNVDVKLEDKTEISRGDAKAQASDLKAGLRVIVDIPEGSKEKIAHSVKIGAAGAADHSGH